MGRASKIEIDGAAPSDTLRQFILIDFETKKEVEAGCGGCGEGREEGRRGREETRDGGLKIGSRRGTEREEGKRLDSIIYVRKEDWKKKKDCEEGKKEGKRENERGKGDN